MRVIKLESDVQYVAVVVGCELAVEDGSFVRLLRAVYWQFSALLDVLHAVCKYQYTLNLF